MGLNRELEGLLVVSMDQAVAAPYCALMLADAGARVIKVERPETGDDARAIGPFVESGGERESAYFLSLNRGKQSIALDLKDDADRSLFERLVERADILVENFRPGTMEKLGYGWDVLHDRHPRLIYAATSGFGHSGPYARRPAYDLVVQAMGGIMSLTGTPGGPPTRVGSSIGDITAGLFTAIGVNAALFERSRTGIGRKIDVAMLDSQVAILENAIARYQATGEIPGPIGARHPSITPFEAFQTQDGFVVIAAGNDSLFARLCKTVGRPELAERDDFATNELRTRNHEMLRGELETTLSQETTATWLERLEIAEIPCGPINDIAQVLADEHVRARNMLVTVPGPGDQPIEIAGNPIKFDGAEDPKTRPAAPKLDADRQRIVRDLGD